MFLRFHVTESLTPTLPRRIVKGFLAEDGRAFALPETLVVAPGDRSVDDDAIVPDGDGSGFPSPADGQVVGAVDVFVEEGADVRAFLALEFLDVDDEGGVVEEGLKFGDGMRADLVPHVSDGALARWVESSYQRMLSADRRSERVASAIDGVDIRGLSPLHISMHRTYERHGCQDPSLKRSLTSEVCTAWRPSKSLWKVGLNLSNSATWLAKIVSPPLGGALIIRSMVYAGGLASNE